MPLTTDVWTDEAAERFWTSATVVTLIRTIASLGLVLVAAHEKSLELLVIALAVYWIGDTLDGAVARWRNCETRIGAVTDMLCDRLNCAGFYLGLVWLKPIMAWPVALYLFEFMVIDLFLSLAFLAWAVRSPNYFYAVDHRIWQLNWSKPAKAVNSGLFAIMLLVTNSWLLGVVIGIGLNILKIHSLAKLLKLGLPVPARPAV